MSDSSEVDILLSDAVEGDAATADVTGDIESDMADVTEADESDWVDARELDADVSGVDRASAAGSAESDVVEVDDHSDAETDGMEKIMPGDGVLTDNSESFSLAESDSDAAENAPTAAARTFEPDAVETAVTAELETGELPAERSIETRQSRSGAPPLAENESSESEPVQAELAADQPDPAPPTPDSPTGASGQDDGDEQPEKPDSLSGPSDQGKSAEQPESTRVAVDSVPAREDPEDSGRAAADRQDRPGADTQDSVADDDRRVREENKINELKSKSVSDAMGAVVENEPASSSGRRLIKADPSLAVPCSTTFDDDDDDPDFPETPATPQCAEPVPRGGLGLGYRSGGTTASHWQQNMALDLATQRVTFKSERRHTLGGCDQMTSRSRPGSALSDRSSGSDEAPLPHQPGSHVASELQRQFLASSQWTDMECLSLTLEEVVHIRSVLTKAELDSLPVECHIKEDVARGKLCFLCMKTRFTFFGAKGQSCRLCQRVVCSKCCAKMRIPTEHFASIPVYTLSPSSVSPQEEEARSLLSRLQVPDLPNFAAGSAPTSPNMSRQSPEQTQSLPPQPLLQQVESKLRRARLYRSRTVARPEDIDSPKSDGDKDELAAGVLMTVCKDCKAMVRHIIVTWKKRRERTKRASAPARPRSLFIAPVH